VAYKCQENAKKPLTRPVIDHCHITGKVRGLLCSKCNKALGLFSDNLNTLEQALKYLKDVA
jgi:hypothetical protein